MRPMGCHYQRRADPHVNLKFLVLFPSTTFLVARAQWLKRYQSSPTKLPSGRLPRTCSLARSRSVNTPQILKLLLQTQQHRSSMSGMLTLYCAQPIRTIMVRLISMAMTEAITERLCDRAHTDRLACLSMIRIGTFFSLASARST